MVGSHRSSCDVGLLDSFTRPAEVVRPWPFPLLILIALIDFCAQSQWGGEEGGGQPLYIVVIRHRLRRILRQLSCYLCYTVDCLCVTHLCGHHRLSFGHDGSFFFFLVCFSLLSLRWCSTTSQVLTTLRDSMTRSAERDMDGNFQCKPPTVIIFLSNRFFFFSFVLIFFLSFISMNAFHTRPGCWWVVSSIQKRRNPIKWLLPFLSEIKEKGKKKGNLRCTPRRHPPLPYLFQPSSYQKRKKKSYIYTPKGVYSLLLLLFARENMMEKRERDWTAAGRWLPYNRAVFLFPCVSLLV